VSKRSRPVKTELPTWEFDWRGKRYLAIGRWEIGWIKWAMKNNPKALDTFVAKELKRVKE